MKEENRKYFVYYGNKTVLTRKLLVQRTLGMAGFTAMALFFGFMTNGRTKAVAAALLCYVVAYVGANLFLAAKIKLRLVSQCVAEGVGSMMMSICFLLVSVLVAQVFEYAALMTVLLISGYFDFMLICLIVSKFFIDRGAFKNKKDVQKRNIWMFSLGGGLLAVNLLRAFGLLFDQNALYMVFAVGSYIAAILLAPGVMHWMKYYFIRKYGFENVEIDA